MVSIRRAEIRDLQHMQNCNLWCLPENYTSKYYLYHAIVWQSLLYVAEDINSGKIVGYVLAKQDDDNEDGENIEHGHITSLSVLRSHRKLGLASKLMLSTHRDMDQVFQSQYVSLHVRVSNRAALGLYRDKLGYETHETETEYYADMEDAYNMRKWFRKK
ncbi:N-alpha-acetyltransferase 11 [Paramecium bursaria]